MQYILELLEGENCCLLVTFVAEVGAALFDPVSRQVITGATNVIYVENMNDRIDALRHFDARREALKKNSRSDSLPLQIDDFNESRLHATSSSATRKLFTSPDVQELGPSQLLAEESEARLTVKLSSHRPKQWAVQAVRRSRHLPCTQLR